MEQQYSQIQTLMESDHVPNFGLKRTEGQWKHLQHSCREEFERSHSQQQPSRHAYIMACLALQKNLMNLGQQCKKLAMKHKRVAFRKIMKHRKEQVSSKIAQNSLIIPISSKFSKIREIESHQACNPEQISHQLTSISIKTCELTLDRMVQILQKFKTKNILSAWTSMRIQGHSYALGQTSHVHKNGIYVSFKLSQESEHPTKNGSRMSNKRKTTKNKEDHKQNSHLSNTQLTHENQHLCHELLQQEQERQAFLEQFSQLLEHHQKYLSHGSSTTRTKRTK